jgi:hypothetical protein
MRYILSYLVDCMSKVVVFKKNSSISANFESVVHTLIH